MNAIEDRRIDKIDHHIGSISEDMHTLKKALLKKEIVQKRIGIKHKRRLKSLKKAQKNFVNISTNIKTEYFEKLKVRLEDANMNKSAYLKMLILKDLESYENSKNI